MAYSKLSDLSARASPYNLRYFCGMVEFLDDEGTSQYLRTSDSLDVHILMSFTKHDLEQCSPRIPVSGYHPGYQYP